MLDVKDHEGGFRDETDLPGAEADVPQGPEMLQKGIRAFADSPQRVVDPVVLLLVVGKGLALGLLVRDGDLDVAAMIMDLPGPPEIHVFGGTGVRTRSVSITEPSTIT